MNTHKTLGEAQGGVRGEVDPDAGVQGKPPHQAVPRLTASRWRRLMVAALVLGVVWIGWSRPSADPVALGQLGEEPMIGFAAPDFTLESLDGGTMQLSSLRGKPVVLNFWATWCPPCRAEMPELERLWQRYNEGDVVVLGVDQGESADVVQRFARDTVGTTFPQVLDTNLEVSTNYQVRALPTTFFIDAEGRIQDVRVGGPLNLATLLGSVSKTMSQTTPQ